MTLPSVVSVCGDPGGASALAPVLELLASEGRVLLENYTYAQGGTVLQRRSVPFLTLPVGIDDAWIDEVLRHASLLLAATSANGQDHERRFLAAARRGCLPSLSVLDFWSNYRARFVESDGSLVLPDQLAVMDDQARQDVIGIGIPASAVVVTGHPGLEGLASRRPELAARGRALRTELGIGPAERLVVFVSQPIADLYRQCEGNPEHLGFEERGVLAAIVDALASIARDEGLGVTLLVRPHPRETGFAAPGHHGPPRMLIDGSEDAHASVMAGDLVVGMNSVLLLEAALLGRRVLSVQPGLGAGDRVPWEAYAEVDRVSTWGEVAPALRRALARPESRSGAARDESRTSGAARSVADCVYALLRDLELAAPMEPRR